MATAREGTSQERNRENGLIVSGTRIDCPRGRWSPARDEPSMAGMHWIDLT